MPKVMVVVTEQESLDTRKEGAMRRLSECMGYAVELHVEDMHFVMCETELNHNRVIVSSDVMEDMTESTIFYASIYHGRWVLYNDFWTTLLEEIIDNPGDIRRLKWNLP